jgi:DNA-binding protein H-NS
MTKKTLAQIQSQIDKLQKEAEAIRAREVADVVGRIKEAIAHYGLSAADLGLAGSATRAPAKKSGVRAAKAVKTAKAARPAKAAKTVKAVKADKSEKAGKASKTAKPARPSVIKFADDQGHTWTGVGKRPNWFLAAIAAGKTADELRVPAAG